MTTTLVVMGVSGCGKTTVAKAVAARLGWPFAEGDDFHPAANVAKMHAGIPLDDADRERLSAALRGGKAAVGVVAATDELVAVESILIGRGGTTESHEFEEATLREAADSASA